MVDLMFVKIEFCIFFFHFLHFITIYTYTYIFKYQTFTLKFKFFKILSLKCITLCFDLTRLFSFFYTYMITRS